MADATMELVERIEGMIDTSASYDAMGITRVCRAAMSEAHDAGHALGVAQERERCANFLAAKSAKIAEDAKTIPLGARSFRATLFASCPAWDVEQYVARIVAEDAAAIRAGEVRG